MTTFDRDPMFDPRISDWLEADPDRAPGIVLDTVVAALPSIPQRRASRVPWRFPAMSMPARLAVAAVIGVLLLGGTLFLFNAPGQSTVGGPGPTPSPSPTPVPSAAAVPSMPPPLTGTFTSKLNGISIAYPEGWMTSSATQPWTLTGWPNFNAPNGDFMFDGQLTDHLFIALASQPLGGKTGDQWVAATLAADECAPSEPITIDGASGRIGVDCNMAAVALDGRGYVIVLYTSGDDPSLAGYDRAWFEQALSTIDLRPQDAVS